LVLVVVFIRVSFVCLCIFLFRTLAMPEIASSARRIWGSLPARLACRLAAMTMEAAMTFPGESNTIPFPSGRADGDTLGGRIWRARDALGLSLEDLASRLGLPEGTVSGWERDHAEPETKALFMLAGVLSVSPSWLIAGIGEAPADPSGEEHLHPLLRQLQEIHQLHDQTGKAIAALETEVAKLIKKDQG
jgi:transcriptional regulator with XRE-family HTH domain